MSKHSPPDSPVLNLFRFRGTWILHREVYSGGERMGCFTGSARFTTHNDVNLKYVEEGILHLTSLPSMIGRRSYIWSPSLDVYFETGEFFHRIPIAGGGVVYQCSADIYLGQYEFTKWPQWSLKWFVNGPKKDYELVTLYQPM